MHIVIITALLLTPFIPFLAMAARRTDHDQRLMARFMMLQSRAAADISNAAVDNLLKDSQRNNKAMLASLMERWARYLKLQDLLLQAGCSWKAPRIMLSCGSSLLVVAMVTEHASANWHISCCAGLAAASVPVVALRIKRRKRLYAMDKALPQVVEMMARALRAGHSLSAAISIVAEQGPEPARTEFGEVFRKQKFGLPLRDAFLELLARVPSQDVRVLVTGILVQRDTGGNLTQILDRTSGVIRDRLKLQGDIRVHTAQGRFTGWILCALPIALFLIISFINPDYSRALIDNPVGRKCLYGGLALLAVGAVLIGQIVTAIEV